ncbi:MAG: YdcF family protein [Coriobacteriia bacterium]|nr:YdcF family protein [Coriobacteriia bacterium]MBN2822663.1 YdcF family protein [Coriobacteriia bacterium]
MSGTLRTGLGAVSRGVALFFGCFSLANAVGALLGSSAENIWWIDMGFFPGWLTVPLGVVIAALLVAYAVLPVMRRVRRWMTCGGALLLAGGGLVNSLGFWRAWDAGTIDPLTPVPFSAVLFVVFVLLALGMSRRVRTADSGRSRLGALVVALVLALAFPLAQVLFFGTTDYRRPAEAVVVLGAKAWPDGRLSTSLEDRVQTAVELYQQGTVSILVMSGATGAEGIDESVAMRDRAVQLGVPAEAIVLDHDGVNTDSTVANTTQIFRQRNIESVLVVSQFYHLPRIKMAYRAAGVNVLTVPAASSLPIPGTPVFVLREVPGFWVYWARGLARGVV